MCFIYNDFLREEMKRLTRDFVHCVHILLFCGRGFAGLVFFLHDPVRYGTKLVLIVQSPQLLVSIGNTHDLCRLQVTSQVAESASDDCK